MAKPFCDPLTRMWQLHLPMLVTPQQEDEIWNRAHRQRKASPNVLKHHEHIPAFDRYLTKKKEQAKHRELSTEGDEKKRREQEKRIWAKHQMYFVSPGSSTGRPAFRRISLTEPDGYWEE